MEDETLEELFDHGDVLSEARDSRRLLINLSQQHHLERIIYYITTDSEDPKHQQYSYLATELLALKKDLLLSALMMETGLLTKLHEFLVNPAPLSPTSLSVKWTCKALNILWQAKLGEMISYHKKRDSFVATLNHLQDLNVFSFLVDVFHINDTNHPESLVESLHDWLLSCNFPQALITKLDPSLEPSVNKHAAELLNDIIDPVIIASALSHELGIEPPAPPPSPLIAPMLTETVLSKLFGYLFNNDTNQPAEKFSTSQKYVLSVLRSLIKQVNHADQAASSADDTDSLLFALSRYSVKDSKEKEPKKPLLASNTDEVPLLFQMTLTHLKDLHALFTSAIPPLVHGQRPMLGISRMKIIEIVGYLMKSRYPTVHATVMASPILDSLLDVFFAYPCNNIAHFELFTIVEAVFKRNEASSTIVMLKNHKLLDLIVQANAQPKQREYQGFFIKMSRMIENLGRESSINEVLKDHAGWKEYASGKFVEQKTIEDKLLGGYKPSKNMIMNLYEEEEEEEADEPISRASKVSRPPAIMEFPEKTSSFQWKMTDIKPFELLPMDEFDEPFCTDEQQFPYRV